MMKKILVVDDKHDDLEVMKEILCKEGFKVTAVNSGKKALQMLMEQDFDLLLLDILMPALSGYEVTKTIKKLKTKFPIIYVSIVPKDEADLKGVEGFIQKPFTIDYFINSVKKFIVA